MEEVIVQPAGGDIEDAEVEEVIELIHLNAT